jgi:hypothetical protein
MLWTDKRINTTKTLLIGFCKSDHIYCFEKRFVKLENLFERKKERKKESKKERKKNLQFFITLRRFEAKQNVKFG